MVVRVGSSEENQPDVNDWTSSHPGINFTALFSVFRRGRVAYVTPGNRMENVRATRMHVTAIYVSHTHARLTPRDYVLSFISPGIFPGDVI